MLGVTAAEEEIPEQPSEEPVAEEPQPVEPPPEPSWEEMDLPANHPGAEKYKTHGAYHQAYSASGEEGRRLAQRLRDAEETTRGYQQLLNERREPVETPQPKDAGGYFGFKSKEHYTAMAQADLEGTLQKVISYGAANSPEVHEMVNQSVQEMIQPYEHHRQQSVLDAQFGAMQHKYPGAKQGTPESQAACEFMDRNPWTSRIHSALADDPSANIPEVMYKLGTYDLLEQKVKSLEDKMKTRRKQADTARPGTGGTPSPKDDGSAKAIAEAAALDAQKDGEEVSASSIKAMERSLKNSGF